MAASLERGSEYDRRRFVRTSVQVGAGLRGDDRPSTPVTVFDLSPGGAGIETGEAFVEPGMRVWLKLPGLQSWAARVAWSEGGRTGLSFDSPLHPAVVERYARS